MEEFLTFNGLKILLTTAESFHECQAVTWFEKADVVVSISDGRVKFLKERKVGMAKVIKVR